MNTEKVEWHSEILPQRALGILSNLSGILASSHFYLAGGTGLALLLGHRKSHDLDFFNLDLFNEEALIQSMQSLNNLTIVAKDRHTLHIVLENIKVSFIGYNFPLLFQKKFFLSETGISFEIADEKDIACMKISAISSRGTKRDFIDLYMVAKQYSLLELFNLFKQKFSMTPYNNVHILKSLTYFADADIEPIPEMLIPISWESVKQFFITETPKLL